jgi:hypothetical protein
MKVGHIDLKEVHKQFKQNVSRMEREIDELMMDRWLDADTAHEFHTKRMKIRSNDLFKLHELRNEIAAEVSKRKKEFGE